MIPLWQQPPVVEQSQRILNAFQHWTNRELLPRSGDPIEEAQRLFEAECVVLSHTAAFDPILNYGNAAALALWEYTYEHFTQIPSRLTAEPAQREERELLLQQTSQSGYADNYRGIRISRSGRRFRIEQAILWNLLDTSGNAIGQAAKFSQFVFL